MKKTILILAASTLSIAAQAQTLNMDELSASDAMKGASEAMGGSITSLLSSQLGVSEDQAAGGLGSVLTLASEKLSAGEFDQLAELIPGADGYMKSAKDLGAISGAIGDMDGLMSSLSALGIDEETVAQFVPVVKDYLTKLGGSDIQALIGKVLG